MQRTQKILTASAVAVVAGAATYAYYNTKKSFPPLNVCPKVDLKKYLGGWYEIARLPSKYKVGCFNTKAYYSLNDDGSIEVVNICSKVNGKEVTAKGKAFVVDRETNAKLKVQFAWPFSGDYWILDVGKDYEYALVGSPSRENLWVLSRTVKINGNSLKKLKNIAIREGFDVEKLIFTVHKEIAKAAVKEKSENTD